MKKFIKILSSAVLLYALYACEAGLPPIVIHPDPVFDKNGIYRLNTISIYDEEETVITVSRVYGLSKEVEMSIGIDMALLDEYNKLNGTQYELMPAEYFTIPESVTLKSLSKTAELPVMICPKAMADKFGLEKANNYAIPISILGSSFELDEKGAAAEVIILPQIVNPEVNVVLPDTDSRLNFIKGVALSQDIVLNSQVNFTTIDPSKATFEADVQAVAEFNEDNGTDYKLLEPEYYTVKNGVFDEENMNYAVTVSFSCHNLPDEDMRILPLKMKSGIYGVNQKKPIYILVHLNILKIWVAGSGNVMTTHTGKGAVTVELNAPIDQNQPVDFYVDNTKVGEYNAANGTGYSTLDPSCVSISATAIPAGEKSVRVSYTVDMKGMEYDSDELFLVPLVLSREGLYQGTEVEGDVIYICPDKSLEIPYIKTVWGEEKSNRKTKGAILHSNLRPSKNPAKQKYAINYNEVWADGLIYFNILDESVPGYPERLKLGDFVDRPYDRADGYDKIIDNGNSYVDTETGIVHFDLKVMDNAYASQGGFPIQIDLTPEN